MGDKVRQTIIVLHTDRPIVLGVSGGNWALVYSFDCCSTPARTNNVVLVDIVIIIGAAKNRTKKNKIK